MLALSGDYARQEVILPRKTVLELSKLLDDSDSDVAIDLLGKAIVIHDLRLIKQ